MSTYDALAAALDLVVLRNKYREGYSFANVEEVFQTCANQLYRFDQTYRLFCENLRPVKSAGKAVLDTLAVHVENVYSRQFIDRLAISWGQCVDFANFIGSWRIPSIGNQYDFFRNHVEPLIVEANGPKVYVIISDAFRYECADELVRELNTESRKSGNAIHETSLSAMLGVLPSYTALGMASLLPHRSLDYKLTNTSTDVVADGISTAGIDNRAAVLSNYNGTAIKYERLLELSLDEAREFVKPHRVVYVYHDRIDATGDKAPTEGDTFEAVRRTINELKELVTRLFHMSGSRIFITADHGFLFQRSAPADMDRSELKVAAGDARIRKKRYVIDPEIPIQANAWHGQIRTTAGIEGSMQFLVPKGASRFNFSGGSRFVHGGAMPQEIVVPLISIKKLQGKAAKAQSVRKVGVTLLGNLRRIVNQIVRLEFIQTEAVGERNRPRTLKISLRDEQNEPISNEETVTFDSQSPSLDDRRREIRLTLRTGDYERGKPYFLVLNDPDSLVGEYQKIEFKIDLTFSSDF